MNIGPGMEFDISVLTGDVAENWKTMLTEIRLKLIKEGQKFSKKLGQWDYFGEPIGDFNTEICGFKPFLWQKSRIFFVAMT